MQRKSVRIKPSSGLRALRWTVMAANGVMRFLWGFTASHSERILQRVHVYARVSYKCVCLSRSSSSYRLRTQNHPEATNRARGNTHIVDTFTVEKAHWIPYLDADEGLSLFLKMIHQSNKTPPVIVSEDNFSIIYLVKRIVSRRLRIIILSFSLQSSDIDAKE